MQCPNCYNEVPNTANVCGNCGTLLRVVPEKKGLSGLVWGIIEGLAGLILLVVLGGIAYFFLVGNSSSRSSTPPQAQP